VLLLLLLLLLQGPSGSSQGASRTLCASRVGTTSGPSLPAHPAPAARLMSNATMDTWLALTAPANLFLR
jgi:hypothetical protein